MDDLVFDESRQEEETEEEFDEIENEMNEVEKRAEERRQEKQEATDPNYEPDEDFPVKRLKVELTIEEKKNIVAYWRDTIGSARQGCL